jgi:hypothetical protein
MPAEKQKEERCHSDTALLQSNISEGDFTLQGLVVEVKNEIVLIQTPTGRVMVISGVWKQAERMAYPVG